MRRRVWEAKSPEHRTGDRWTRHATRRRQMRRWLPVATAFPTTVAVLLSACDGGLGGGNGASEGRTINLSGPTVRIGAVDDPDYAFGTVADLAVGPDGRVYSVHRNDAHVRIWTPIGEPAGVLGGEGQGPGEFTRPGRLGFFGDSLWVMDTYAYRVSYFDPSGAFLGRVVPEVDLGGADDVEWSPPRPEAPLRDGSFVARSPEWSDDVARGELTKAPMVHMSDEGGTLAEIWVKDLRQTDVLALLNEDGPGGFFMAQPFEDDALTAVVEDGLIVVGRRAWDGEGEAFSRVSRLDLRGDTVWRTAIPYEPTAVTRERLDSAVAEIADRSFDFRSRNRPGLTRAAYERDLAEAIYQPDWTPPVRTVVMAEDGSVWLERFEPVVIDEGSTVRAWWTLSADGILEGTAYTPDGLQVMIVTDDAVWGVETDELGVDYIVRYDLVDGSAT